VAVKAYPDFFRASTTSWEFVCIERIGLDADSKPGSMLASFIPAPHYHSAWFLQRQDNLFRSCLDTAIREKGK
jgi:hypothetical protein